MFRCRWLPPIADAAVELAVDEGRASQLVGLGHGMTPRHVILGCLASSRWLGGTQNAERDGAEAASV